MSKEFKIKEAIKTNNGKLIYVIELQQGDKDKIQMYIDSYNKIYFESNNYSSFSNYATFDITEEAHKIAKEIFLTYLQAYVKTRLLELKQLELVLEAMGLQGIIRQTIIDNSTILTSAREEIIQASIENTTKLIEESTKDNKNIIENTLKGTKKIIKATMKSANEIVKANTESTETMIEEKTNKIIEETVRPIARKNKK